MTTHQQAPPTPDSPTCVAEHPALASPDTEVVKACAVTNDSSSSSSSSSVAPSLTTAQDWYDQGEHVWYDPVAKQIVDNSVVGGAVAENVRDGSLRRAFCRVVNVNPSPPQSPCTPTATSEEDLQQRQRWMTFLPGTPEGSYGFHQVEEALRFPDDHASSSDNRGRCDTDATEMSQDSVDSQAEDNDTTAPVYNRQHTQVTHASSQSYDEQEDNDQQAAAAEEEKEQKEELEDSDTSSSELSRLYLDYLGQGDSDHLHPPSQKRRGSNGDDLEYLPIPEATATASSTGSGSAEPSSDAATIAPSSTTQRADLVEAHWHALGIQRTVVVSVGDASSLVVMELLHRQRARLQAGTPFPKIMHVLSVNGKYVAKTRQTSQLPAMTQLLRSERMGAALAAKAQRSDFTMSQCLQPYLKGLNQHVTSHYHHLHHEQQQHQKGAAVGSHHAHAANKQQHIRHVRQQVMDVVRRHGEAAPHAPHAIHSLQDYARTVDDHLQEQHKYRWHLPRLFDMFCQDQGITFQLATTHRHALKQVQLVRDSLVRDYDFDYEDLEETCPGIQYDDWTKNNHSSGNDYYLHHQVSSTAFLLGSSREQLQPLLQAIHRLVNEEIPLSDNTHHGKCDLMKDHSRKISFDDDEEDYDDHSDYHHHPHHEDDSWHMQMSASDLVALEMTNGDHGSQDTRLEKEIVFDADDAALTDDYHLEWAV